MLRVDPTFIAASVTRASLVKTLLVTVLAGALSFCLVGSTEALGQDREDPTEMVDRELGIYPPSTQGTYLSEFGQRLASALEDSSFSFSFQIVDSPEPNAFAFPSGEIFVSRGLMALLNSEDELANLLGHEMTHVTREHSRKGEQRARRVAFIPRLLSVPGKVVGELIYDDLGKLINTPFTLVRRLTVAKYSRRQEREADQLGLDLANRSGFRASALVSVLERMQREVELSTGETEEFRYFGSHPTTRNRVAAIQERAALLDGSREEIASADSSGFLEKLDGLFVGDAAHRGLVQGQRYVAPLHSVTMLFPETWQVVQTPVSVGAVAPDEDALVSLMVAGPAGDPESYALAFLEELNGQLLDDLALSSSAIVEASHRVLIGRSPAYIVTLNDSSATDPADIHFLWVSINGVTFQITSVEKVFQDALRDSWLSLRPLTAEECRSVTGYRLRLVRAVEGETIFDLTTRTGNGWTPAFTSLVNEFRVHEPLPEDTLIKIAREEPFSNQCDQLR